MKDSGAGRVTIGSMALAISVALAGPVYAEELVFNVNSVADLPDRSPGDFVCETDFGNGVCTLRAAVMEANAVQKFANGFDVTINLPAGTYLLTRPIGSPDDDRNGDLDLYGPATFRIVGAGFDRTIIDAHGVDRAFHLHTLANVTLSDLRVQGGRPPDAPDRSGGGSGGGILNEGGYLSLVRCLVRDNATHADWYGGGILSSGGSLTLTESVVRINLAAGLSLGGGISAVDTATTISRSTVNSNTANTGGGIFQNEGSLHIVNSTISGNVANVAGGGLYLFYVSGATLNSVTVATNTAAGPYPAGSDAYLNNSTAILSNSILAAEDPGCSYSSLTSNDHNYIGSLGSCTVAGLFLDAFYDLKLGTLSLYGGATVTHPLLAGSIAINAGSPPTGPNPFGCYDQNGAPLTTDQRGVTRKIGAACDLGAFEVEPIGDANGDGLVNVADVFYLVNFLYAGGDVPKGRGNVDGVAGIDVNDVFYLINFLFAGGQPPH